MSKKPTVFSGYWFQVCFAALMMSFLIALLILTLRNNPSEVKTEEQLLELVEQLQESKDLLHSQVDDLQKKLQSAEQALVEGSDASEQLRESFLEAQRLAGLTEVQGPGIVVRMGDSQESVQEDEDPYFYIVHDVDLQVLVNELRAAGAEAIAINDHRLVARSSIRCVGPTVLVDTNKLTSPYTVKAIGDSEALETAIRFPGGFLDSMRLLINSGGYVDIQPQENLVLPAYSRPRVFQFMKSVTP